MTARRVVLGVLAALALAGCGDGGGGSGGTQASGPSIVLPSVVSTAAPPLSPEAPLPTSPATTATPGQACGDSPLPSAAADTTTARADVDGDGRADEVSMYRLGPPEQIASWHLRAHLAAGGGADLTLSGPSPGAGAVGVIGGAKVDGDASEEIWARVGAGASRVLVGLFVFRSCHLEPVIVDREPATFPLGGTVRIQTGLECTDADGDGTPDLVAYESESDDGATYVGTGTVYHQENATLTRVGTVPISYSAADPAARRYTSFTCGPLGL